MPGPGAIEFWYWWVLAAIFVALEVFAPGTYLLWLGIAAAVVGVVLLAIPGLAFEFQLLVFALFSLASVIGWRLYGRRLLPDTSDHPTLNRRGLQYVGQVFTLEEPIVNGRGIVRIADSRWMVYGEDLPAGTRVRVCGVEGTVLRVEPAPPGRPRTG